MIEALEARVTNQQLVVEIEQVVLRTDQLEATNKELDAFTYSVSHDLRAPLRHISGFADMLAENTQGTLDADGQHYLQTITRAAERMGTLIDNLLAFSRMGRAELRHHAVDLKALATEVRQTLAPEECGRNVVWRIADLPLVSGDYNLLRQVLINLFSNALKYSRPRDPAIIEVAWHQEDGEKIVSVRDNGVGYDETYAGKLFGVFQRLHRADEFEGTGIGLANVRRINLAPRRENLGRRDAAPGGNGVLFPARECFQDPLNPSLCMHPPLRRILLVEDSEPDVEMTLSALKKQSLGNQIDVARDGVEAMDYLHRRGNFASRPEGLPVAVLLDLKMPRMDGLEVLSAMKTDALLKSIPVVMLTSSQEEQDLLRSYALGVNAYVVKPVGFSKFVEAVQQIGCFWAVINQPPPRI